MEEKKKFNKRYGEFIFKNTIYWIIVLVLMLLSFAYYQPKFISFGEFIGYIIGSAISFGVLLLIPFTIIYFIRKSLN